MRLIKTKILIIGGGAAGLSAGFYLDKKLANHTILLTRPSSNSVISPWNLMVKEKKKLKQEMLKTGCQMNQKELIDVFLKDIPIIIKDLKTIGLKLKKSNIGLIPDYLLPGKTAIEIFLNKIKQKGIKILIGQATNFIIDTKGKIIGVQSELNKNKEKIRIFFNYLVLASGGLGGFFKFQTGSPYTDGSILSLCYEAGLSLTNLEFFMFHPFLITDKRLPRVLISGDILTKMEYENEKGESFLSPEIATALKTNQHHYVFPQMVKEFYLESLKSKKILGRLICTNEWFEDFKKNNEFGYLFKNFTKDRLKKIEIHPAFHFSIGGLVINKNAQTSQKHIYAAGEITGGLHGANRIGGLAVLEALIFGRRAALDINRKLLQNNNKNKSVDIKKTKLIGRLGLSHRTKEWVWQSLGPIKDEAILKKINSFLNLKKKKTSQEKLIQKIIQIAILRKESIGAFIKKNTPQTKTAQSSFIINKKIIFK